MIIKTTRLQAWASAGGGGKSRPSPPPPLEKIFGGLYWGPFCYFFFVRGPFCYVFLILGAFRLLFISWCRPFLGLPPPLRKFLPTPMIARRVREHAPPQIFLCDRNLVSSGHVLLRFCLKNEKNNDKL